MQLTALVEDLDHVCCRYRLAAFRPFLEQAGHELELRQRPRHTGEWIRLGSEVRRADAVIVQRKLLRDWQLRLLRGSGRLLLFDFDDAVFLRNSFAARGLHSSRRHRRFGAIVRSADAILAGNAFLAEHALRWAGEARVHIVPTCVNPARYPLAEHARAGAGTELVWIGSASTIRVLDTIRPLLEGIGQRWPGLRLKIICDRFLRLRHLPVIARRWSAATEAGALASADIGISWLPDDLWSRGKCGLKVLQYMAAGLPVVANPVGLQAKLVRHGETGFLAATAEEWGEAIGRLSHDPALRRQMGRAGRHYLEKHFSIAVGARRWLRVVNELQAAAGAYGPLSHPGALPARPATLTRRLRFS